jgi:phage shock protein E
MPEEIHMWSFAQSKHDGRERVRKGALLLDVRTAAEFASGHLEGALNIPVQELEARLGEVGPRSRSIVVYCRSGARSATAAATLRRAGFDVLDIGGMGSW